ncbi:Rhodanese-like domain-containing protein [Actinidia chinensis var. chinensis]|uniref:Rhodanese-like domain-containing protein n=1 Tax=Actinidia chinensis var. chinensis TaxID=1590841 RepID=A0A2R6PXE6_ACTCC|nr:Rhodanese-like domain-containing protein [Actinidia chinensis var. chinensis]
MTLLSGPYAYSKMAKEDPEEVKHRKAQFLIYKVLEKADSQTRPSCLGVRVSTLRIKVGKRLKRLRKSMLLIMFAAKNGFYKQMVSQLKAWKRLLRGGQAMVSLPPALS